MRKNKVNVGGGGGKLRNNKEFQKQRIKTANIEKRIRMIKKTFSYT